MIEALLLLSALIGLAVSLREHRRARTATDMVMVRDLFIRNLLLISTAQRLGIPVYRLIAYPEGQIAEQTQQTLDHYVARALERPREDGI